MPTRAEMRKKGYKHHGRNMLTAIVQDIEFAPGDTKGERRGRKYRNIMDNETRRKNFELWAKNEFPNAFMIMYYDHTGAEKYRVKLK